MSQFHYLEDEAILGSLGLSSKSIRACLPDSKARFLVLTYPSIEDGSNTERASQVTSHLRNAGLKPCIYKESGSDSIQIFLTFSAPVDLDFATAVISNLVSDADVLIHRCDKPFVLPLQKGFAWLNSDFSTKVECDQIAIEAAMAMFLHDLDSNAVPPELLEVLNNELSSTPEIVFKSKSSPEELISALTEQQATPAEPSDNVLLCTFEPEIEPAVSNCEDDPTIDLPEILTEVAVSVGQQLLLFPVELKIVQPELPKERPKRRRKARSNLSADVHFEPITSTLFILSPPDAQGVLQFSKEAYDD